MAILPENEYTEFENREYINPQVSLDEQNAFVDNLRQTQQANNQQIKTDTYNLGTAVPSNLGGLTGGEGYFTSRYQTPQTNTLVNDLRATAQANALSQVLANEQAKMKKRYNDAYNANKRRNANTTNGGGDDKTKGETEYKSTSSTVEVDPLTGSAGNSSVVDMGTGEIIDINNETGNSQVRDENRYISPEQAGYVKITTPFRDGAAGEYNYSDHNGGSHWVRKDDGYSIKYDTVEGKLVQVKD